MDEHRDLLISYTLLPWLNPARTRILLQTFGDLSDVRQTSTPALASLLNLSRERASAVRDPLRVPEIRQAVSEWRDEVVALCDSDYPDRLAQIHDPPTALYVRGERRTLNTDAVAIVGSRRASRYGTAAAELLASHIASAGLTTVSGLARGIDGTAHRATVEGGGRTIAVLGTGIDIVYPSSHQTLARRIVDSGGVLVSELAPGQPPRPSNFPVRNRIISGLALGSIIVEATARSGSLITARLTAEQDRELFVVPGSIFSAGSEGPHRLAQYGAKLVHDANDVLEELGLDRFDPHSKPMPRSEEAGAIHACLRADEPVHVDVIVSETGIGAGRVAIGLIELEEAGLIEALPGSYYALRP